MKLVSESFKVPESLKTPDFTIRKLCLEDAALDYKAVMSSIDIIRRTRGSDSDGWPQEDLTYKDDQADLAWHQKEFENRTSFAYTVMSVNEKECLGCFYLYPPGYRGEKSKDADVDVNFWVTEEAHNDGLYDKLYFVIVAFLKRWPFQKIVFTNKVLPR